MRSELTKTLIVTCFFLSFSSVQAQPCDGSASKPCLVLDRPKAQSILHLRDTSMILKSYDGNINGIKDLSVSGSEQPSEKGWKDIADFINSKKSPFNQDVLVIDLRQEDHGYINGNAITLTDKFNWLNLGKPNEKSSRGQEIWLSHLRANKKVNNILTSEQFVAKDYSNGRTIGVESIHNEPFYVHQLGFNSTRFFISDHRAPTDAEVDRFVALVDATDVTTWFHIHCRGGKGRTTTVFAMFDMLKNANKATLQEIIARQASIPPYYNLFQIKQRESELVPYYEQRVFFLTQFYEYARQRKKGFKGSWTEFKDYNN